MYNIDFNLYKTFYYVIIYNNFTKASEKLCISQPAVTQAIKKLEEQLNVELFKRTFIVLDKNGKEAVNEAFEDSSYDEYNIRYMPCINYNDKYYTFAYFNTSTNRVNVVFFDKNW